MRALEVARRASLRSETVDILRRAIYSGQLVPGSRLNEVQISHEIGVSRAPLREAFRQLEEEGVLVSTPHRGTFVATATAEEFAQVVALRRVIEPFVIRQALEKDREKLLRDLRASAARIRDAARARDIDAVSREHTGFHAAIYRAAGGIHLRLWERLQVALSLYAVLRDPVLLIDVPREHDEMLRLIDGGDYAAIKRDLERHLSLNFSTTLQAFDRATSLASADRPARRKRRVEVSRHRSH